MSCKAAKTITGALINWSTRYHRQDRTIDPLLFYHKILSKMNPLRIVMLGAPGSGKGTYSKAIAANIVKYLSPSTQAHTTLPVLSSGDLIRSEIAKQSDLGRAAQQASEAGRLVPDALVTSAVLAQLEAYQTSGYILDGFPRTLAQAESLSNHASGSVAPTTVINVNLATDVIVQKLLGRRVCAKCGVSYNLANVIDPVRGYDMPAMLPPASCAQTLTTRVDDTDQVIAKRLEVYQAETKPLIEWYQEQGLLIDFVVKKGMKDVPILKNKIKKHWQATAIAEEWSKT